MAKKKKKNVKASVKSSVKTGLVIFILVLITVCAAFVTSLYFYTRNTIGQVVYPPSPLTKIMNESKSYISDDTLTETIKFPTIPVLMSVGGSVRGVTDTGTVYRYNTDLAISVYETEQSTYEVLAGNFAYDLYNGSLSGTPVYVADTDSMDLGYFNGYPAEYQCGDVQIVDENGTKYNDIYVTTMLLDLSMGKKVLVVVQTDSKDALYSAETLLEALCFTVMDVSQNANGKTETDSNVTITEDFVTEEAPPVVTPSVTTTIGVAFSLNEDYKDGAVVQILCDNRQADIGAATIERNDGADVNYTVLSAQNGLAFYHIINATKGDYIIELPSEAVTQEYKISIIDYKDYDGNTITDEGSGDTADTDKTDEAAAEETENEDSSTQSED